MALALALALALGAGGGGEKNPPLADLIFPLFIIIFICFILLTKRYSFYTDEELIKYGWDEDVW